MMASQTGWCLFVVLLVLVSFAGSTSSTERTWTDTTGKYSITAELLKVHRGDVVLRRSDGKEITVSLGSLSDADRTFIEESMTDASAHDTEATGKAISGIASDFYNDLHNKKRDVARKSMTRTAQQLMNSGQSPLAGLPKPDKGKKAIRVGKVKLQGKLAEIPVMVRANGKMHKTKLHLRYEEDQWRVFALSATYPDGEKSINFEAEGTRKQQVNPLQALVGKPLELAGLCVDGSPLDMSRYAGKVVLVDFWATWCGPCRAEIPNILQNWELHHDRGFDVIAISVDRDMNALKTFVADEKPPWVVVADKHPANTNSMGAKYGIRGIPAFILIGRDGKVAAVNCRGKRLGQQLALLLGNTDRRTSQTDPRDNPHEQDSFAAMLRKNPGDTFGGEFAQAIDHQGGVR